MLPESAAPERELPWERPSRRASALIPHLVLVWSLDEPERIGEAIPVGRLSSVGRGEPLADDPAPRVMPQRMRPAATQGCTPIANARIARLHLLLEPDGEQIKIRCFGRAPMRVNGQSRQEAVVREGDVIELHNAAVFIVVTRPKELSPLRAPGLWDFDFGAADRFGITGESEAAWRVRDEIGFAAATDRHVLLLGESGVGKELAARAIHGLSSKSERPLVSRNAATLPDALVDAELFGNAKNYPNPGMPERGGLIGEARGSTLFLDEIGELPERSQAHLLRVLDAGGEYQRLGDARPSQSSFRLVAATNRPLDALKHDFLARFTHRITLPGLMERREDIALVLSELLRRIAASTPNVVGRFFERRGGELAEPRIAPDLIVRLLRHPFTHHVRELDRLLWLAIGSAEDDYIGVTEAVDAELKDATLASSDAADVSREQLLAALREHGRSPTRIAKALGLKNRYVLHRLLKKHGLRSSSIDDAGSP